MAGKKIQIIDDKTLGSRNRRLKILDQDEIKELYGLPHFSDEEREQYFTLTAPEEAVVDTLHSIKSKLAFILQLGYFKARHLFFVFSAKDVTADMSHVLERYFPDTDESDCMVSKITRLKHQHLILTLCRYKLCDSDDRQYLEEKAREAAMITGKPIYVFRQVLLELNVQRLIVPGYSFLQDMVGRALMYEQKRLVIILREWLSHSDKQALDTLLDDQSKFHTITQLKRELNDFSAKEIKHEIECGKQIRLLYLLSQRLLPVLKISNENVKYYASLVGYYSLYRLKRFDSWTVYIYLLCFVYHRYQRHYDNLLTSYIFYIRKFTDAAKAAAKERVYEHRVEANQNLHKAAQVLKLFTTDEIPSNAQFHEVQACAFAILERNKLDHVANQMTLQLNFNETEFQWEHIDKLGFQFKRYLRPVLSSAEFSGTPTQTRLIEAINFLKNAFSKGRSLGQYPVHKIPVNFIPGSVERYLYVREKRSQHQLIPDRYEFYICRLLRDRLEAGDIYCRDSVRFRSFEDDLIDDKTWRDRKNELITQTGLSILQQPIEEHLSALEQDLELRMISVNKRIAAGENAYIKIKKKHNKPDWSLKYPGDKDETNHPVFDGLKQVGIGSVLDFVNRHCQFMDAFEHVLGRYVKTKAVKFQQRYANSHRISYKPLNGYEKH